tara:strand:+ start:1205 stop:2107 length:903 start_codon:yes stop_codon:yes gene_type:complete
MGYLGTPIDTNNTFQSLQGKRFSGNASTTNFTLDIAPSSVFDIEVYVENVRQDPNSAYTLSGTTLAFTAAPGAGTNNIYVIHQAKAVGTINPTNDSVTASSIADDAVESEHLNNNIISGQTALAATPADTDEFLVSDAGTIKRIDYSLIKASNAPAFCARESGQQTLNHNTHTNLNFATEEVDSNGAFASNVFTVPSGQAGKYYIFAQLNLYDAEGNLSSGILNIWKGTNGTKLSSLYSVHANSNNTQNHLNISCAVIADLAEGNVIGASATMTTDDSGTVTSYGGDQGTRILGFKLAGV